MGPNSTNLWVFKPIECQNKVDNGKKRHLFNKTMDLFYQEHMYRMEEFSDHSAVKALRNLLIYIRAFCIKLQGLVCQR